VLAVFVLALAVMPAGVSAQTPSPNAIDPATEKPDNVLLDKPLAQENEDWSEWSELPGS
jgi:hypothetical protein